MEDWGYADTDAVEMAEPAMSEGAAKRFGTVHTAEREEPRARAAREGTLLEERIARLAAKRGRGVVPHDPQRTATTPPITFYHLPTYLPTHLA